MSFDVHSRRERPVTTSEAASGAERTLLIALGWSNVGLGMVGAVLPGMPTTVFLLIALWAFARSSPRFHDWLYTHPRFGPTLQAWQRHRVIPQRAKCLAGTMMAASYAWLVVFLAEDWVLPVTVGAILLPVALYIFSRPGRPPR